MMSSLVARIVPRAAAPRVLASRPRAQRAGRVAHISALHSHVHAAKDGPSRVACGVRVAVAGPAVFSAARGERVTTRVIALGLDNPSPSGEDRSAALKQMSIHIGLIVGVTALALAFPCASLAAAKAKAGAAATAAGPIPFLPFTHNQILHAVNLGSLPAWFSLVLLPRWQHTDKITLAVALGYSLLYVTLAGVMVSQALISMDAATFFTVEGIKSMFLNSTAVLAGWAHFIIFDLFTARYFVQDSGRVGIPHLAVVPCILGCMFFGPLGLLTYVCVKKVHSMVGVSATATKTYRF